MMKTSAIATALLAGMLLFSAQLWAAQACSANVPLQAPDSRYVANGNGTVTDKASGLVWQTCSFGQVYNQNGAGGCTGTASTHTWQQALRSEEHTSELQSLMRISYDVFCLKKKNKLK